jgi:IS5 family transposase
VLRHRHAQRSIFEVMLPDAADLWDPTLRGIDEILDDEDLVEPMAEAMARRRPRSRTCGRPSTPAEVALRLLVLKHLYGWSFDECEREVRGSLVYRAFCRIGCERVPDAKTLVRLSQLLDEEVLRPVLERLVEHARELKLVRGRRMRVDTTVVETNIHYPTDSSLLADGVRVLTRTAKALAAQAGDVAGGMRDRTRSVSRQVLKIARGSRQAAKEGVKTRLRESYGKLMAITRAAVRDADKVVERLAEARGARVDALKERIGQTVTLIRRVLDQTRARVFKGDRHYPGKVLSLFEPHTEAIRKGKLSKPTEFGKLVKIQEAEGQFITDYEICATRVPDQTLWKPSLDRHTELFDRVPRLATADAGFGSAANERLAREMGVPRVALPRNGHLTPQRRQFQRQRWFRKAMRWRTGGEGRISVLKRRHGLSRCRYRGLQGMERWVGLGVIANNLCAMAGALQRQA